MGVGRTRPSHRAPGSLTILAVVAAIALWIPAVGRGTPASGTVSGSVPYPVGAGVSVVPPADSTVDLSVTRSGVDKGTASFLMGPVRYLVVVGPYLGTVAGAAYRMRDQIISSPGYLVSSWEWDFTTESGLAGRRGTFTSWGWTGLYAVFVVNGLRIGVTVTGTHARLRVEMPGIETSIRTVAYRGP